MRPAAPDQQNRASAALLRGALVIVPTETVYGLAPMQTMKLPYSSYTR